MREGLCAWHGFAGRASRRRERGVADVLERSARPGLPPPDLVRDAVIGPQLAGSGKARQIFCASTSDVPLDHFRFTQKQGFFSTTEVTPFYGPVEEFVAEPTMFAGPYFNHFGHMASEGIHRLWPVLVFPELRDIQVVYQLGRSKEAEIEPWFRQLIALFGIVPERVTFLSRSTMYAELHVPQQGRVLGGAVMLDGYLDLFPLHPIARSAEASDRLYVSRRRHMHSGTYLGETFVETALANAGFEIVYPETLPLQAVLERLANASLIVFSEGSAIHNLELCGRIDARIFVIGRRPGTGGRFAGTLDVACDEWDIFASGNERIVLDWDQKAGRAHSSNFCTFLDLRALMGALADFCRVPLDVPDPLTARRAVAFDLLSFLMNERAGGLSTEQQLGTLVRMLRQNPSVRELLDVPMF